jgi:tRNA-2-methylthio-N6-dimethylallyladenosine synthase
MNRKYTREHYLKKIDSIKKLIPDVDITTDVMVGFPGETDDDYEQTLTLFEQVQFTHAFMFAFSIRPGTESENMPNQIPEKIKKERLATLINLQTDITKKHYSEMVGKPLEVLFTGQQKRNERTWMGQDYGCKRVLLDCNDNIAGELLTVNIQNSTGMTLLAERIDQ